MHVRLATLEDAEPIREIYNLEVTSSTATFDLVPRSVEDHHRWMLERSGVHPVIVAIDDDGDVAGYASLSTYRPKAAYNTTVENSVYVRTDQRGTGVGFALVTEIVSLARQHGFHVVLAHISGGEASIKLHEKCGFVVVGRQHEVGRKFGRWLDVVVMERLLND